MSRFADPRATRTVDLGPCECPGAPHPRDEAVVRAMFSSTDIDRISSTSDTEEGAAAELAKYVVGWNLLGPNGEPWPPGRDSMLALMPPTLAAIVSAIGDGIRESSGLPNASSARSPASPRAGASRTRKTTPKPGT